jgi:hypothetical protein
MPRIYKTLTAVIALISCISLIITKELSPLIIFSLIFLVIGHYRSLKAKTNIPKKLISIFSLTTFLFFILDSLILTGDLLIAVAHLTILFQAIKSFDLKEPWDHLQISFMSLLQIIILSELTISGTFGIIFVVFLIALVSSILISHFIKEKIIEKIRLTSPVITISILVLFITGVFFVITPRIRIGFGSKKIRKTYQISGFSDKVDFGSLGEVKLDYTVVMRAATSNPLRLPVYWKGSMLDYFDGVSWENTLKDKKRIYRDRVTNKFSILEGMTNNGIIEQKIFLEPISTDVIFGLGNIVSIEAESRIILTDASGAIYNPDTFYRKLNYTAYSTLEALNAYNIDNYVQLPSNIEKIKNLSKDITQGLKNNLGKAVKIENYLKTNYSYSLKTGPTPADTNPIEDFLFRTKTGYCEHYATSMVLMLRSIGIPARIVTGFINGEQNEYGGYITVRQSDAHSWVEAIIENKWKRFDPTPPAPPASAPSRLFLFLDSIRMKWYRYVVNYSHHDQQKLMEYISMPVVKIPSLRNIKISSNKIMSAIMIIMAIGILVFLIKMIRFKRYDYVTAHYLKFRRYLRHKGASLNASSTPADCLREIHKLGTEKNAAEFVKLYEATRFGNKKMSKEEKKKYKAFI